jgi:hypothetical protein
MPELWRTISVHERYEVSSLGRIRNTKTGRILKPWATKKGHLMIALGGSVRAYVHHLVCAEWHGQRPEGLIACHRNDIKTDNRPENLYWGTYAENTEDALRNGKAGKLTARQVSQMRKLYEQGTSFADLGRQFGVTRQAARQAVRKITWNSTLPCSTAL